MSVAGSSLSPIDPAQSLADGRRAPTRAAGWRPPPSWLMLGALMTVATVPRMPRLWAGYWGDEALTVGIASHPLVAIPRELRFDGSPPLYYFLLHIWIQMFGTSEAGTHSLSLLCAAIGIPAGWWCARILFGRPAAWGAAVLMSFSPYLTTYGTETRMYALLALWGMLAVACFVRALLGGGGRYLTGAVAASILCLYTHNWGLYLVGVLGLAGLVAAARERSLRRPVTLYLCAVAVAYLPWLPSFVQQLGHTGAPWAPRPTLNQLWYDPLQVSAERLWPALLAAGLLGVAGLLWAGRGGRRPGTGGERTALALTSVLCAGVVVTGWIGGQLVRSWAPRYLGLAVVPALVVLSGLLVRSRMGRLGLSGLALILAGTGMTTLTVAAGQLDNAKSNALSSVGGFWSSLQPGDLVISAQVSQLPLVAFYTPREKGLRYATPLGGVMDPTVVNWTNLEARLTSADPAAVLAPILDALPVGGHVLLVQSAASGAHPGSSSYDRAVAAQGLATTAAVLEDPDLAVITTRESPPGVQPAYPVTAVFLVRTSAGR